MTSQAERPVAYTTRGRVHGPMVRLMSPSDLGEVLKPFVFLDLFDGDMEPMMSLILVLLNHEATQGVDFLHSCASKAFGNTGDNSKTYETCDAVELGQGGSFAARSHAMRRRCRRARELC